ncbi:hypothetical protein VTL71DRAFT_6756 [Oculimacula yallundae]|uniref:C2H2-type domain-containing protein n=1 Tax=Oculimacula yallundae TaxID=86028 RepID=A0ABR4BXV3_9HELO
MSKPLHDRGYGEDAPIIIGSPPRRGTKRGYLEYEEDVSDNPEYRIASQNKKLHMEEIIEQHEEMEADHNEQASSQGLDPRGLTYSGADIRASSSKSMVPTHVNASVASHPTISASQLVNGTLYHRASNGLWACTRPPCTKTYKTISSVDRHVEAKHNGPVQRFNCPTCNGSFSEERFVRRHQATTSVRFARCNDAWNAGLVPGSPGYVAPSNMVGLVALDFHQSLPSATTTSRTYASIVFSAGLSAHPSNSSSHNTTLVQPSALTFQSYNDSTNQSNPPARARDQIIHSLHSAPSTNQVLPIGPGHHQYHNSQNANLNLPKNQQTSLRSSPRSFEPLRRFKTPSIDSNEHTFVSLGMIRRSAFPVTEEIDCNQHKSNSGSAIEMSSNICQNSGRRFSNHNLMNSRATSTPQEVDGSDIPLIANTEPVLPLRLADPLYWWNIAQSSRDVPK